MEKEPGTSSSIGEFLNVHFVYNLNARNWAYTDGRLTDITGILPADPAQLMGLIDPDDHVLVQAAFARLQKNQLDAPLRLRIKGRDGYHWIELSAVQLNISDSDCLLGTVYDITADVEHNTGLAKYANKKNSILHMLSHDLRGPLGIAKSLIKSLGRSVTDEPSKQKLTALSEMIGQAIGLIVDLTKREFLDTAEVALVIKPKDLVELISQYIAECRLSEALAARHFHFITSADRMLVAIDEPKFTQVLNNLISNALKFTQPGGNIKIELKQDGTHVELRLSDDGIGIPADLLPYIFERYSRARREGLQGEPTEGIGLSIARSIITWHNATIECESEEGIGTTFIIRLKTYEAFE
ncbi:sensor histidine kinase KdpD [Pedobacter sp. SYP-B3415]|uniref:sensor histidine kinase n=1 Tax=Pedobacter sp. SYP-B3415 TaxID=2496641 RepID=UPI00101B874A|nr:HAMP domain-containing sensor histidine kinase [Pedobacter sp. SYP-B3415]